MNFTLETVRLTMLRMRAADVEAVCHIANEPGVRKYLFDDKPVAPKLILDILAKSDAGFEERKLGIWTVREKDAERAIGFCGLRRARDLDEIEILYALSESKWTRGYAIEAASAVLRYAFDRAECDNIIGIADVPNVASWRVLEKLGMHEYRPAGAQPHLRYAVVGRAEYPPRSHR
jgi:[ribosomal protein S5]-alanine N-acetyltransferase